MTVVSKKDLTKALIKYDGNSNKAAKEVGITRRSVSRRISRNPDMKQEVLTAREQALHKAKVTRELVYKRIREGLDATVVAIYEGEVIESDAPDQKERREYAKMALNLFRDLDPEEDNSKELFNQLTFMVTNIVQQNEKRPQTVRVIE